MLDIGQRKSFWQRIYATIFVQELLGISEDILRKDSGRDHNTQ